MYKLFIVDDEPGARNGLRDYFNWSQYGIEVVGEADDGESAWELIEQTNPDIVLTDVKMPNMDGIQLSNKLRERYENIKIIFISGYDDAEFLKSAMRLDAIDYIFKPVNVKELGEVVKKVVDLIGGEEYQKDLIYNMNIKLMQSMPLLREKFFITLIRDGMDKATELKNRLEFLELNLPVEGLYVVFVISIDDKVSVFEEMPEKDRQLTSFAIMNICQELIDNQFKGYAFEYRHGEYVCVLNLEMAEEEEKIYGLVNEIKDNLLRFLQLSLTIGVGKMINGLSGISHSYCMAYDAVSQKLFLGKNRIIMMDNLETGAEGFFKFDFAKEGKLLAVLKAGDEDKLEGILDEIFSGLSSSRNINIKYCQNICLQLILLSSRLLIELEIGTAEISSNESDVWEKLFKQETVEDMKSLILSHYKYVCNYVLEKRNKKSRNVIGQVKEIINKRYHENLTVADIASEVYLTSTYICMIFKQETGETINDYITKVRMENAKEMLKDSRNKFYDICYAVGYADPSYFSKQFKKFTGFSPSEYREKVI